MDVKSISQGILLAVAKQNSINADHKHSMQNLHNDLRKSNEVAQKNMQKKIDRAQYEARMKQFEAQGSVGPIPGIPRSDIVDATI